MKKKTVQLLAFATVAALGVGVVSQRMADKSTRASGAGEALLPALEGNGVNEVAQVTVEAAAGTLTFQRQGADWAIAEKSGWPARSEKVRSLVLGLREAEVVERKTSDAAKFERLGLVEPDADGSTSKRVTLRSASGEELASVLIGNRRTSRASAGAMNASARPRDQFYALPGNAEAAVLMSGKVAADARLASWAETQVVNVARERMKAVRVTHADGASFEAVRETMDANDFTLLDVPAGSEAKSPSGTMVHMSALGSVRFDDVQRADALEWTGDTLATAEFFTEKGLRVRVESIELPNEDDPEKPVVWARYAFDVAPDAAPALPKNAGDAGEVSDEADADSEGTDSSDDAEDGPTREDLEQEARDLSEATAGWAFALPTWKSGPLRTRPDAVLQPIPEPEPGNGPVVDTPSLDEIMSTPLVDEEPEGDDGEELIIEEEPPASTDGLPDGSAPRTVPEDPPPADRTQGGTGG